MFSFFPYFIFHFQTLTGGLSNLFGSKPKTTEVQPVQPAATQQQTGFFGSITQPAVAPRTTAQQQPAYGAQPAQPAYGAPQQQAPYQPPPVAAAPAVPAAPAAPVEVNLDKIPGLDDDFDLGAAPAAAARPRPSAAGLKPGQKPGDPAAEGGLLGGLTSGISGLASGGIGGVTGKVGDLTGGAGAAAGGAMKAAGGLFKKFGF